MIRILYVKEKTEKKNNKWQLYINRNNSVAGTLSN